MKYLAYIFCLLIAFTIFSCNDKKEEAIVDTIDSTTLTIAVLPTYDCIPFYYAAEEGIFESLDVNVRLVTFKSSLDADTAFSNGHVLAAVTDIVKASLWRSNGDSVKVVMAMDPTISLVTAKAARLFQTKSIKERIIAITRHSMLDFMTDKILESAKMVSTDLNKPQINDIVLRTQMNNQDQYDGALLPEPYTTEATRLYGAKLLSTNSQLGLHYMAALVFNDSTIAARREEIKKVVTAYNKAVDQLNKKRTFPLHYIPKKSTIEIPDTLFEYQDIHPGYLPSDTLLNKVNTWLNGRKLIKNTISYKSLVDSTFISK